MVSYQIWIGLALALVGQDSCVYAIGFPYLYYFFHAQAHHEDVHTALQSLN
jgi:hypothetical protein